MSAREILRLAWEEFIRVEDATRTFGDPIARARAPAASRRLTHPTPFFWGGAVRQSRYARTPVEALSTPAGGGGWGPVFIRVWRVRPRFGLTEFASARRSGAGAGWDHSIRIHRGKRRWWLLIQKHPKAPKTRSRSSAEPHWAKLGPRSAKSGPSSARCPSGGVLTPRPFEKRG